MSCCGGNCGCGTGCSCGSGCGGCKMHADLSYTESSTTAQTIVMGVRPVKPYFGGSEMEAEAENGCKCGSNCSCDPCNCK